VIPQKYRPEREARIKALRVSGLPIDVLTSAEPLHSLWTAPNRSPSRCQ
jgi:hypothetical protein